MFDSRQNTTGRSVLLPPRQEFSFPILKPQEIFGCLKELGVSLTEEEYLNPEKNKDQIRRMWEQLTEICTGSSRDELNQPAFSGLSVLNYPELHEDSIPHINNFRMCQKMMETCGITDYSLNDLIAPSTKRLRRQLSGVINFAKFREERLALLTDLTSQRMKLVDNVNKTLQKGEELENKLVLLKEQTAEESKIISIIENEIKEIKTNVDQQNLTQAEIKVETNILKEENNKLRDTIITNTNKLDELIVQKKKLESQIVNSPERFRKQIADKEQSLSQEQAEIKAAEKKIRELSAWIENIDIVQLEINSANESVQELRNEVDRQKGYVSELESKKQELSAKREVLSEIDQNTHQINRASTRLEEKLSHLRKQHAVRSTENKELITDLHKKLIDAENIRIQMINNAERVDADALKIEREAEAEKIHQEQVHIYFHTFNIRNQPN
jgi:DNA repair exonuclease SbcCD ATPase subunit